MYSVLIASSLTQAYLTFARIPYESKRFVDTLALPSEPSSVGAWIEVSFSNAASGPLRGCHIDR